MRLWDQVASLTDAMVDERLVGSAEDTAFWLVRHGVRWQEVLEWAADRGHLVGDAMDRWVDTLPPADLDQPVKRALRAAALRGEVGVIDRLALPPFSLGPDVVRRVQCLGLAAGRGRINVLDRLAEPPFMLNGTDDADDVADAVRRATENYELTARDRLGRAPYS